MGKRYGRNQKRKHRALIAKLEDEVTYERSRASHAEDVYRRSQRKLLDLVEKVEMALGEHSAVLPPKPIWGDPSWDDLRLDVTRRPRPRLMPYEREPFLTERFTTVLRKLIVMADEGNRPADLRVHALVHDELAITYYVSAEAVANARYLPEVRQAILDAIAYKLAEWEAKVTK